MSWMLGPTHSKRLLRLTYVKNLRLLSRTHLKVSSKCLTRNSSAHQRFSKRLGVKFEVARTDVLAQKTEPACQEWDRTQDMRQASARCYRVITTTGTCVGADVTTSTCIPTSTSSTMSSHGQSLSCSSSSYMPYYAFAFAL
eukprot:scaffold897_cov28-Prasinocladus_malaysianus.AAC.1